VLASGERISRCSRTMALQTSKVNAYYSNIRHLASRLRILSVQPAVERAFIEQTRNDAGVLGDKKQFPFPGNVTSQAIYKNIEAEAELIQPTKDVIEKPISDLKVKVGDAAEKNIELKMVACPDAMKKKVGELFPNQNVDALSVLNITQKTQNDMSVWSPNMEIEWMALSSSFVESAKAVCDLLNSSGYWADFIDPSTGKPYLSKTETNATLNVTDEEYRSLGFEIIDAICCKILMHKMWGKMVFVGTIITTAPVGSHAVSSILAEAKN
uniref:Uncharacterized protein n=1 Tax=Parascaris univalens TaxID=6257 RepID=A0A915AKE2_PARUN